MPILGSALKFRIGPLLDDSETAITGATWALVKAMKPDDSAFTVTYAPNGNGFYTATTTTITDQTGVWALASQAMVNGVTYSDASELDVLPDTGMTPARAAKLDSLGAASVTVQSPVINQVVEVYQGDDYRTQRPLSWALTNAPDLTGATVALLIISDNVTLSIAGTVSTPGQATQTVIAHLTQEQTNSLDLPPIATNYDLSATLASTEVTTIARGPAKVVRDV